MGMTETSDLSNIPEDARLLDRVAVLAILSISERTLRRIVATGDLKPVNVRGCQRYRLSDVIAYSRSLGS
jgi:hypothetical protein